MPADMQTLATVVASASTPLLFVGLAFTNDVVFSKATSEAITNAIRNVAQDPAQSAVSQDVTRFLNEYFPRGQPFRFWTYVFAMSLISMATVLAVYCTKMPDLVPQLLTRSFLQQLLFDGLVKVVLVNAFAYYCCHYLIQGFVAGSPARSVALLVADAFCKALLFIVLTAFIYALFAAAGSAFGGSVDSALRSVPVTLREAVLFHNLTGVYLYALPLSAFPIYLAIIIRLFVLYPAFARGVQKVIFFMPIAEKPFRAAALVFFVFASLSAVAMALLVAWPSQVIAR